MERKMMERKIKKLGYVPARCGSRFWALAARGSIRGSRLGCDGSAGAGGVGCTGHHAGSGAIGGSAIGLAAIVDFPTTTCRERFESLLVMDCQA